MKKSIKMNYVYIRSAEHKLSKSKSLPNMDFSFISCNTTNTLQFHIYLTMSFNALNAQDKFIFVHVTMTHLFSHKRDLQSKDLFGCKHLDHIDTKYLQQIIFQTCIFFNL